MCTSFSTFCHQHDPAASLWMALQVAVKSCFTFPRY
jgi:hypothetical protein